MLFAAVQSYITSLEESFSALADDRRKILGELAKYIDGSENPKLNFICTHNSRRSHISQIWAHVASIHYGVPVATFSGGTEATAFHPNAIEALRRAGFEINKPGGKNPRYEVSFGADMDPIICYSKAYDDTANPSSDFAAIMTCSEADAECPVVFGASKRIKLLFNDPKESDGLPNQDEVYDERTRQIATEIFFAFSQVNKD